MNELNADIEQERGTFFEHEVSQIMEMISKMEKGHSILEEKLQSLIMENIERRDEPPATGDLVPCCHLHKRMQSIKACISREVYRQEQLIQSLAVL